MLGLIKEIDGQKTIIPLTTDTGTGAPVGTLIQQYKKKPMSGYLYCDGSTFDQNTYPALYMYLGSNVLPDYSNNTENGYVYIKATSGLAENQQDNVLNDVKDYVDGYNSYSTDEVKTGGTWIDGKPIYRKVIDFGSLPNATTKIVNTGLDFAVCNVIKFEAFAKNTRTSDDTSVIPVPYGTDILSSVMKDGTISIYTTRDWTNFSQCYVTIEYTKTTD